MSVVEIFITYMVSWWLILFMVLPFGVQPEETPKEGHAPSAPSNPKLRKKIIITSVLAVIPTMLAYSLYS